MYRANPVTSMFFEIFCAKKTHLLEYFIGNLVGRWGFNILLFFL